jgi:hypothetical protein
MLELLKKLNKVEIKFYILGYEIIKIKAEKA